jgi:hypothetical protein
LRMRKAESAFGVLLWHQAGILGAGRSEVNAALTRSIDTQQWATLAAFQNWKSAVACAT